MPYTAARCCKKQQQQQQKKKKKKTPCAQQYTSSLLIPCAYGKLNVKHHRTPPKPEINITVEKEAALVRKQSTKTYTSGTAAVYHPPPPRLPPTRQQATQLMGGICTSMSARCCCCFRSVLFLLWQREPAPAKRHTGYQKGVASRIFRPAASWQASRVVHVSIGHVVFTDFESCPRPISTDPGSMEACKYGLTRRMCFVARRLEVVAAAGLLWISWCVLNVVGFRSFFVSFISSTRGLLQARGRLASTQKPSSFRSR